MTVFILIASGGVNVLNIHNDSIRFIDPKTRSLSNTVTKLAIDKEGAYLDWFGKWIVMLNMKTEVATSL